MYFIFIYLDSIIQIYLCQYAIYTQEPTNFEKCY